MGLYSSSSNLRRPMKPNEAFYDHGRDRHRTAIRHRLKARNQLSPLISRTPQSSSVLLLTCSNLLGARGLLLNLSCISLEISKDERLVSKHSFRLVTERHLQFLSSSPKRKM
ncbi:hypothetical protein L2E82_21958 [Cichorium intybus]|uniref:Uncharacterized protein n=1 Tax=Cichorium intybus TaxID=13427 RepID=A0ACB9DXM3_CICIN|nr:hypothetical protein L2E82_21958 [Cichorium intybus]